MFILALLAVFNFSAQADFSLKDQVRSNCRQSVMKHGRGRVLPPRLPIYSPILDADRAEALVDDPSKMIRNLKAMDQQNLLSQQASVAPWSDHYWPLYLGGLGRRYNDPGFTSYNWKDANRYISKNPVSELILKKQFDAMSPSEKYDFLFDVPARKSLTSSSWAEGEEYLKQYGKVETWMGLCHGWSAAAIMLPDPKHKVNVETTSGALTFYPSDIKALATLLWARGSADTRFVGGRCNSKNPSHDPMGRSSEQDCLDNNPGTWHMAIVNQIGQFHRSFVMDATYDYEVWNQPVFQYQYSYYDPRTGKDVSTLQEALVERTEWQKDPRSSVRADDSKYIVGIRMNVTYVSENYPSQEENQPSLFNTVQYEYDLELNRKMEIIGGEWYSMNHPDFLWVPETGAFPNTIGGRNTIKDLNHLSEADKKNAAANAAYGLPYGPAVQAFFKNASN